MTPNFGNIPQKFAAKRDALFTVLPVPYEATTTYRKGTAGGPAAVIGASAQVELYDEELGIEIYRRGIRTLMPFTGSVPQARGKRQKRAEPESFLLALETKIGSILKTLPRTRLVTLGGEHSITVAPVRAFAKCCPRLSVLQLDAHADLRDEYEGSPYSHACAMRRVAEVCPIVQVGIRNISAEEASFANVCSKPRSPARRRDGVALTARVTTFFAHEWHGNLNLPARVLSRLGRDVYVTIDVDVFDPSFVPGTGTPEPGGLSWYDVLDVLRPVFAKRNVVAFDVVELSPIKGTPASEFTAAKLIYRLMGYWALSK